MPEEGLLCILKQSGIVVNSAVRGETVDEEDDVNTWELADEFKGSDYTLVKTNAYGKLELQWTYKGFYYIYLLLKKDYGLKPCCERKEEV
jgi:hypothetical protein